MVCLRRNHRLWCHLMIVVYCCRRWIFGRRNHRFSGSVRRCQWGSWCRRRWIGIREKNSFEGYSINFKLHNQLWFTSCRIFCFNKKLVKLLTFIFNLICFSTFTDDLKLHSIQHRCSQIIQPILLLVVSGVSGGWSMMRSVLNTWWLHTVRFIGDYFCWRHMRIVVTDVMMIVVDGTFTIQVAIGANQASLRNGIIINVSWITFALDRNDWRSSWWDWWWWLTL